jgi:hypothetical protein
MELFQRLSHIPIVMNGQARYLWFSSVPLADFGDAIIYPFHFFVIHNPRITLYCSVYTALYNDNREMIQVVWFTEQEAAVYRKQYSYICMEGARKSQYIRQDTSRFTANK